MMFFLLTGCANTIPLNNQSATEHTDLNATAVDSVYYLVSDNEENLISIKMPYIENMSEAENSFVQKFVHKKLEEMTGTTFALTASKKGTEEIGTNYSQYCIIIESQVTQNIDTHTSIVFTGFYNKQGSAHPIDWLFSINYNRKTLQEILFSKKYVINAELYSIFSDYATSAIKEECGGTWPTGWGSFSETLCSQEAFLSGMNSEMEFCYYMQDGDVIISYPVAHTAGDHKEVKIPNNKLVQKTGDGSLS